MKYISFQPKGEFPFVVLFSPQVAHQAIAEKIGHPVMGAGFVSISQNGVHPSGFSTSLGRGPDALDGDLISAALEETSKFYPAPRKN